MLNWQYGKKKRGMYLDSHEQEDVVKYRDAFIEWWKEKYEPRMVLYDDDGKVLKTPNGFPVPQGAQFQLILVTHNESTFYEMTAARHYGNTCPMPQNPNKKEKGSP